MKGSEGFVVLAEFKVKKGRTDEFLDVITRHAEASFSNEAGCLQFDVIEDGAERERVFLYEVYANENAYDTHRELPQVAATRELIAPIVDEQRITTHNRFRHPRKAASGQRRVLVAVGHLKQRQNLLQGLEQAGFELVFNPNRHTLSEAELVSLLPGCSAVIAGGESYDERVFAQAPELRCIARLGVGHDRVDLSAATRAGVAVAMAFGTNHEAVADHSLALISALAHRLVDYHQRASTAGEWGSLFHGRLSGATVGLVGFGRIGRAVAKRCQAFNMEVLVADPAMDADTVARLGCRLTSLEEMLGSADFLSLHAPAGPATWHMIDRRALAAMKRTAFLINTARGDLVDEAALIDAVRDGRLAGAGLDVFETEPLPAESPLRTLPGIVLSPHVAGQSEWAVEAMARRASQNIVEILNRNDPGGGMLLNPEVLEAMVTA